jgi:histidinol-phosphatase (PHP family)
VKVNYHIHTKFSDGSASIDQCVENAIANGFNEIAFTDHLIIFPNGQIAEGSLDPKDLWKYEKAVTEAAQLHRGRIEIKLGVEADYIPGNTKLIEAAFEDFRFDFSMLSIHFMDGICVHCDHDRERLEKQVAHDGFDKLYRRYLSLTEEGIDTGLFNVVAHLDLIRNWGFSPSDCTDAETRLLTSIREHKMCLEISSRGLRHPSNSINPSSRILSLAKKLDIPITLSTDAHSLDVMNYGYDELVRYARNSGYRNVATYQAGILRLVEL